MSEIDLASLTRRIEDIEELLRAIAEGGASDDAAATSAEIACQPHRTADSPRNSVGDVRLRSITAAWATHAQHPWRNG